MGAAVFTGATFRTSAIFRDVHFLAGAVFTEAVFDSKVDFERANFKRGGYFISTTFSGVSFVGANYFETTRFAGSTFNACADFSRGTFREDANFDNVKFVKQALFIGRTFRAKTTFHDAKFAADADFKRTTFEDDVHFSNVTFEQDVNFDYAFLNKRASFSRAAFRDGTFVDTTFEEDVSFSGATVHGGQLTVKGPPSLHPTGGCFSGSHACLFTGLKVGKDASVVFDNTNLSRANFFDTSLENVRFADVKWYCPARSESWIKRGWALWDEFNEDNQRLDKDRYERVAETYRQLVLNYDRKRHYDGAEQFHIGEMEVLRKKRGAGAKWRLSGWVRRCCNGYAIYGFLSHYGTSYWVALRGLILMLVCFSTIFFFYGFQRSGTGEPRSRGEIIAYDLNFDLTANHASFHQWARDYGRSLAFAASVLTLQRQAFYRPVGGMSEACSSIATILLPAQLALMLLAIRRRFKR
jgi:uncharacterized protein YjbI with pentapeptide repeats